MPSIPMPARASASSASGGIPMTPITSAMAPSSAAGPSAVASSSAAPAAQICRGICFHCSRLHHKQVPCGLDRDSHPDTGHCLCNIDHDVTFDSQPQPAPVPVPRPPTTAASSAPVAEQPVPAAAPAAREEAIAAAKAATAAAELVRRQQKQSSSAAGGIPMTPRTSAKPPSSAAGGVPMTPKPDDTEWTKLLGALKPVPGAPKPPQFGRTTLPPPPLPPPVESPTSEGEYQQQQPAAQQHIQSGGRSGDAGDRIGPAPKKRPRKGEVSGCTNRFSSDPFVRLNLPRPPEPPDPLPPPFTLWPTR
jgi:hypothetical protein